MPSAKFVSAIALGVLMVSFSARAESSNICVNDTPPSVPGQPLPQPSCISDAEAGICPGLPGSSVNTKVRVESVPYFPAHGDDAEFDVGACEDGAFYCPNGCADPRASCKNKRCVIQLNGLLYTPLPEPKKAPAVILIPGSSDCTPSPGKTKNDSCQTTCGSDAGLFEPEGFCAFKSMLLDHGFVVYEVYPRGYGDSQAKSTGIYLGNLIPQQLSRGDACSESNLPSSNCAVFDLEEEGSKDIVHAVTRLKGLSYVDPDKITVVGHSLGAIRTISLNSEPSGLKAAVAISAASESWCTAGSDGNLVTDVPLENEMIADVQESAHPLFLLAPKNDVNLDPLQLFTEEAAQQRLQFQSAIFRPQRDAAGAEYTEGDIAHFCFVNTVTGANAYGPAIINFFERYGAGK